MEDFKDKDFLEGIERSIDSIVEYNTYRSNYAKYTGKEGLGVNFCITLLQSLYDSLTEEPIESLSGYEPEGIVY